MWLMRSGLLTPAFSDGVAGLQLAGVNAHEDEVAVLFTDGLESQAAKRLAGLGLALGLFLGLGHKALHGRAIRRRGQIIAHRIEQQADAVVFLGRAALDRREFAGEGALAHRLAQHLLGDRLAFEDRLQQFVAAVATRLRAGARATLRPGPWYCPGMSTQE